MGGFKKEAWWAEDNDLWGRIAIRYPIAFSWDGGGICHLEASNRTTNRIGLVGENIFVLSARKALQAGEVPSELREELLEYVALKQIQTACRNLQACRRDLAKRNLMDCKTQYLWRSKYSTLFWTCLPSGIYITLRNLKSGAMKMAGR